MYWHHKLIVKELKKQRMLPLDPSTFPQAQASMLVNMQLAPYMAMVAKQVETIKIIVNTASQLKLSHVGTNLTPAVFMCVSVLAGGRGDLQHTCLCKWVGGHRRRPGMMGQMADGPRLTPSHPTSTHPSSTSTTSLHMKAFVPAGANPHMQPAVTGRRQSANLSEFGV